MSSSRIKAQAEQPRVSFDYIPGNWETTYSSGFNWIVFNTGEIETGRQGIGIKGEPFPVLKENVRVKIEILYYGRERSESITREVFSNWAISQANYQITGYGDVDYFSVLDYFETEEIARIPLQYSSYEKDIKGHKAFIHEARLIQPSYFTFVHSKEHMMGSNTVLIRHIGIESSTGSYMSIIRMRIYGWSISTSADGINPEKVLFDDILLEAESILDSISIEVFTSSTDVPGVILTPPDPPPPDSSWDFV